MVGDLEKLSIPKKVSTLTGIDRTLFESEGCQSTCELAESFSAFLKDRPGTPIIIHYAQFEKAFLKSLLEHAYPEWWTHHEVICTHKLSKVLVPNLRSYSLRAVSGFLGWPVESCKRSADHLLATTFIWRQLTVKAEVLGLKPENINELLQVKNRPKWQAPKRSFQSKIAAEKRLALSKEPGIYRFLDRNQRVLYVGKAKNLKSRVNTYFTGRQTKGSRLNEMISQIHDIKTTPATCELEALLLENDAIKRINPPYNRALKDNNKEVDFLSWHDLFPETSKEVIGDVVNLGPTKKNYELYQCRFIVQALVHETLSKAELSSAMKGFGLRDWETEENEVLQALFQLLFDREANASNPTPFGYRLLKTSWRSYRKRKQSSFLNKVLKLEDSDKTNDSLQETFDEVVEETVDPEPYNSDDVAALLQSVIHHGLMHIIKGKWLARLCFCELLVTQKKKTILLRQNGNEYTVQLVGGWVKGKKMLGGLEAKAQALRWTSAYYDHLSIILSFIKKSLIAQEKILLVGENGQRWNAEDLRISLF